LDAPGLWPSQTAVATERVTLLYATRFQSKSAALIGLGAIGLGDPQAQATPFLNARNRRRGHVCYYPHQLEHLAVRDPHGGVIQELMCPSHWDGDHALTRLDRRPPHSQGNGLPVVELIVPVSVLVELGGIIQGFD